MKRLASEIYLRSGLGTLRKSYHIIAHDIHPITNVEPEHFQILV